MTDRMTTKVLSSRPRIKCGETNYNALETTPNFRNASMALHLEIQNGVLCKGQDGGRWADGRQELSRATGPNIVKVQERRTERGDRGFSDSM